MNLHLFLRDPCACLHRRACMCTYAQTRTLTETHRRDRHEQPQRTGICKHMQTRLTERYTEMHTYVWTDTRSGSHGHIHACIGHTYMQTHTNSDTEMHKGRQRCTEMCRPSLSHRCHSYLSETSLSLSAWDVVVAAGSQDE